MPVGRPCLWASLSAWFPGAGDDHVGDAEVAVVGLDGEFPVAVDLR